MAELKEINGRCSANSKETFITEIEFDEFKETFPEIIQALVNLNDNTYPKSSGMSTMTEWMTKVIDYNVSSEPTRMGGWLVPGALKCVLQKEALPQKEKRFANLMGWCLEIFHGATNISDNIIDCRHGSTGIGNKLPWHTMNNLGMLAINDTFMLRIGVYNIIKLFFGREPFQFLLQDAFRDSIQKNILGRALWEQMEKEKSVSTGYTVERYRQVNDFMISYRIFNLPFQWALIIAGREDDLELRKLLKTLMLQIGYYYQLLNDFENVFGKRKLWMEKATGKMKRLTWFFVTALEILSLELDEINDEKIKDLVSYTKDDTVDGIGNLRNVYEDFGLVEKFKEEMKILKDGILEKVEEITKSKNVSVDFFHQILETI